MDHERIKAAQRAMYEAGEYGALSHTLRPAAHDLVLTADVAHGQRVLDVGAGDGNVAIEAASKASLVVGCDLSVIQMSRARRRDRRVAWLAADAERLPFPDHSFDVVLSCFGAVFAPDPQRVTAELFRVVKPGGVVALTSWADDGFMAEMTAAVRFACASPDSFPDQDLGWGSPITARARFTAYSSSVVVRRRTLLINPAVRGAAGDQDFAARYLAQQTLSTDLGPVRAEISQRHLQPNGSIRSDYLLILGWRAKESGSKTGVGPVRLVPPRRGRRPHRGYMQAFDLTRAPGIRGMARAAHPREALIMTRKTGVPASAGTSPRETVMLSGTNVNFVERR